MHLIDVFWSSKFCRFQRQRDFGSVSQSSDHSTRAGTCLVDINENHNFLLNLLHCNLDVCHLFQAKKELSLAKGVTDFSWTKRLLNADFIPSDVGKTGPELIAAQVSPQCWRVSVKIMAWKLISKINKILHIEIKSNKIKFWLQYINKYLWQI